MVSKPIALLLCLSAMAPAGARAADLKTLDCVISSLPPQDRDSIVASAERLITSDDAPIAPHARAAIQEAGRQCAARYHWSPAATDAAKLYVYPALTQAPVDAAIRATGNDPVQWARIFRAMPEHDRLAAVLDPKASSLFVDRLLAARAHMFADNAGRLSGELSSSLESIDLLRARFAAN